MSEPTVVVNYRTQKNYCTCCNQKLPEVKISKVMEIVIGKGTALMWTDWNEFAEYPEDMESVVPDFVHETIDFFASTSYEKIIIEDSEIEKVKEFILREVIEDSTE